MKDWKEKLVNILERNVEIEEEDSKIVSLYNGSFEDVIQAMKEFALLACEEQKKICAENAKVNIVKNPQGNYLSNCYLRDNYDYTLASAYVNKNIIINSPTVKFE